MFWEDKRYNFVMVSPCTMVNHYPIDTNILIKFYEKDEEYRKNNLHKLNTELSKIKIVWIYINRKNKSLRGIYNFSFYFGSNIDY